MNTIFQVLLWFTATIGLSPDTADKCTPAEVFATSATCAATTATPPQSDEIEKSDNPEINNGV